MSKRLEALAAKVAGDGIILTEAQRVALEKAKTDKKAHGECERVCPPGGAQRPLSQLLRRLRTPFISGR